MVDFGKQGATDEIRLKVEAALAEVRPYLERDGGNVVLKEITEDNIVKVGLTGACKSCSMNGMTLKAGIEETIKKHFPQLKKVESVELDNFIS